MHNRKRIREYTKATLLAALPDMAGKIFTSRAAPVDDRKLPAIIIFTPNEPVTIFNDAPRTYSRKTRLSVGLLAAAIEGVDDVLDDLAERVEQALNSNLTLSVVVGGTVAAGGVTFTGTNGTVVPQGTVLKRDGQQWVTQAALTLSGTTGTVAVKCKTVGLYGNVPANTALTLATPITGITGAATAAGGLTGGTNGVPDSAAVDMVLVETNSDFRSEGAQPIGGLAIGYDVEWYEDAPTDLTGDMPPLESMGVKWDLAPTDGTIDAVDEILLPQT